MAIETYTLKHIAEKPKVGDFFYAYGLQRGTARESFYISRFKPRKGFAGDGNGFFTRDYGVVKVISVADRTVECVRPVAAEMGRAMAALERGKNAR